MYVDALKYNELAYLFEVGPADMADVFISYSKDDHAVAESLANDLTTHGLEVWWDFQLYAGDDFHDVIRAHIAKAKAVIVIWSETAVASPWVRGEALEASHHGTLISTFAAGFDPRRVPINFLTVHSEPVGNRTRIIASLERKGLRVRTGVEGSLPTDGAADETPEREGLILDLSDSEVKKLIKTGEARGHITYDELSAVLPAEEFTVDQITEVMAMFSGMGIEVVE